MVSQHGIELAAQLISSFYGDLCSKVCECLLRRGTLTVPQIIRFTELSRENVINCLRVLIHQNCVQAFSIQQDGPFGEAPKIATQYMALFDNVIHKMRVSKFMQIVDEELGKDCLEIFQGLIQHGRLSINQIIDRNIQTAGSSDANLVRENFNRLLSARFVERCPTPEPFLAPPDEEGAPAKKRSAKSAKIAEARQTIEQRAIQAAAPLESLRFLMDFNELSDVKDEESSDKMKLGKKRKQDVMKSDDARSDSDIKKEVIWRANFEEFMRHLRDKACVSYVRTKINNEASIVLRAVLELNRHSETARKAEKSVYLSVSDIYAEMIKHNDCHGLDLERVIASLDQLGCQTLTTGADESYSVDIKSIIEMAKDEEAESVILKRYGMEAYRIFRLLIKDSRLLGTDKISDSTFVEKKDTINILYRLWKDGFLHVEKVLMTGAKQQVILLWRVNRQSLGEHVLDEMFHAALNLRLRIMHELDKGKEILQLPREKLVGELRKKLDRLFRVKVILESSAMNLDDAIMLYHDF